MILQCYNMNMEECNMRIFCALPIEIKWITSSKERAKAVIANRFNVNERERVDNFFLTHNRSKKKRKKEEEENNKVIQTGRITNISIRIFTHTHTTLTCCIWTRPTNRSISYTTAMQIIFHQISHNNKKSYSTKTAMSPRNHPCPKYENQIQFHRQPWWSVKWIRKRYEPIRFCTIEIYMILIKSNWITS